VPQTGARGGDFVDRAKSRTRLGGPTSSVPRTHQPQARAVDMTDRGAPDPRATPWNACCLRHAGTPIGAPRRPAWGHGWTGPFARRRQVTRMLAAYSEGWQALFTRQDRRRHCPGLFGWRTALFASNGRSQGWRNEPGRVRGTLGQPAAPAIGPPLDECVLLSAPSYARLQTFQVGYEVLVANNRLPIARLRSRCRRALGSSCQGLLEIRRPSSLGSGASPAVDMGPARARRRPTSRTSRRDAVCTRRSGCARRSGSTPRTAGRASGPRARGESVFGSRQGAREDSTLRVQVLGQARV